MRLHNATQQYITEHCFVNFPSNSRPTYRPNSYAAAEVEEWNHYQYLLLISRIRKSQQPRSVIVIVTAALRAEATMTVTRSSKRTGMRRQWRRLRRHVAHLKSSARKISGTGNIYCTLSCKNQEIRNDVRIMTRRLMQNIKTSIGVQEELMNQDWFLLYACLLDSIATSCYGRPM